MATAPENEKDRAGERPTADVIVDTARTVGDNLARIGVAAVDGPLRLAPEDLRHNVHDAANSMFSAMSRLHLRLVESTVDAVSGRKPSATAVEDPAATRTGGSSGKQDG